MPLRKLEPFGVEIGDSLSSLLDLSGTSSLRRALARHHLVVLRGSELDDDTQVQLTAQLGRVMREPATEQPRSFVSNVREGAVAPSGELVWHQDGAFLQRPFPAIALYGVDVEPDAAPTLFASNARAFALLPPPTRARVQGLQARHVFTSDLAASYTRSAFDERGTAFSAEHPVVMHEPTTGAPFLYVNGLMTSVITDAGEPCEGMLEELLGTIYDDGNVVEHHWSTGDLVIWDNLAVQHRRPAATSDAVRDLRRTVVADELTESEYRRFYAWLATMSGPC
jgi:taurine dioxygenase